MVFKNICKASYIQNCVTFHSLKCLFCCTQQLIVYNNSLHLLSTVNVPGTTVGTLYRFHSTFSTTYVIYSYCLYFIGEETEAQRG